MKLTMVMVAVIVGFAMVTMMSTVRTGESRSICWSVFSYTKSVRLSVCLSVRPPVTRWYCVKMTQATIMRLLWFGEQNGNFPI